MLIQVILISFLLFAVSRVFMQWRNGNLKTFSFILWFLLFFGAAIGVIKPDLTVKAAKILGIGRGADVVTYLSIVLLFYLLFRIYIYVEDLRHVVSEIISELALKEDKRTRKKR